MKIRQRYVSALSVLLTFYFTILLGCTPPQTSPPEFTTEPITDADVGVEYVYDMDASDADGNPFSFQLTTRPDGMQVDASTGLVTWTPTLSQIGSNPVTARVTDSTGAATNQQWIIAVIDSSNSNPQITSTPVTAALEGSTYTYQATATDPDGDTLTFSLVNPLSGMNMDPDSGLMTWIPDSTQVGIKLSLYVLMMVGEGRIRTHLMWS